MASSKDDYRVENSSVTGGLTFNDPKEGDMLRKSLQYLAQRVGGQLLSGNVNFTKMSMPVHLNEPRSLLERITDDWAHAPHFLTKAAQSKDPIQRLKYVAAFVVSGLHCMDTLGKPFNPILGSTYQAKLADGTPCYLEQTCHHPPVTHYLIQPESGLYKLAGFSGIDGHVVWGLDTGLSSRRIGINVVEFEDGTRIVYNLPRMLVRGLAAERKCEYLGPFSLFYEAHNLVYDFLMDPPQPFRWSPFRARTPSDYMDGVLYRLQNEKIAEEGSTVFTGAFASKEGAFFGDPDGCKEKADEGGYIAVELRSDEQVRASVTSAIQERDTEGGAEDVMEREVIGYARGTFVGYLDVDGERVWDIREDERSEILAGDMEEALGSDCRFREDVIELRKALEVEDDEERKESLIHEAQMLKEKLENIQRNDRKLRAEGLVEETEAEEQGTEENEKKDSVAGSSNDGSSDKLGQEGRKSEDKHGFFPSSIGGL